MNKMLIFFCLFSATLCANDIKKTPSKITRATVYLNGAQITRIANINLTSGITEVLLNNLSPTINESSIQISGLKSTSIVSMSFNIDYLEKKKDSENLILLQNQLESLLLAKNKLNNTVSGLQKEKNIIDNNQGIGIDNTALSLEKIKEIATYYRERSITIQNDIYTITQKLKELKKNESDLRNEIYKLDDTAKEARGVIKLKLDTSSTTVLSLKVSYNVTNAGWFPIYDIKSSSVDTPIKMIYKANVFQQTGTDWKDIKITLSTGDPTINNYKPNLLPKYLNFVSNNRLANALQGSTAGVTIEDLEIENEEILEEVVVGYASKRKLEKEITYNDIIDTKEVGITNTRFIISKKQTIQSNADITTIEIDNFDIPTDYSYYVAPELNENVFLTAKLGNWEQHSLLTGEATIYFEGSYAGKTTINPQATTDSLSISLGVDPNIIVKRAPIKNFKQKSFTGSSKIINLEYVLEIKNNKQNEVQVILEDRIPVTQDKEIKIDNIVTNDATYDTEKGILQWKLNIAPKKSLEKKFSYQLKYPKNKQVNL